MTKKNDVTRREFMSRTAKTAAATAVLSAPAINVLGANERVQLGIIGPGRRGNYLMDQMHRMSIMQEKPVEFIAVADIFDGWRQRGVNMAQRVAENDVTGYDHYKKLLENKDVDAVILATPEHQHAYQMLDVIASGKHMYAEKPMVHTVEEGQEVVKAAEASDCIIQVGTQRRSVNLYYTAHEMVKRGDIGEVTYCEGWWNRNFIPGSKNAAWRYEIPESASEDTINWKEFYPPAPFHKFDKNRYFQWRCYWDYSNGIGSDLMVHQIDAINLVMGTTMPKSAVSSGKIYRWDDGRTTPDTWSTILEYDEGFQVNYHSRFSNTKDYYGIRICGTKATIEIDRHFIMKIIPEYGIVKQDYKYYTFEPQQTHDRPVDAVNGAVQLHLENWIDCIKANKKDTNCPTRVGYYGAAIARMAVEAYFKKQMLYWDKTREKVSTTA
ncbi:hypothetical protein GF373_00185 [bacterium]|nr:hypothetical protein [bacterium]